MTAPIAIRNLEKHYESHTGPPWKRMRHVVKAVDDVSFELAENQVVGLVGESGCGKTTVGKLIVKLLQPTGGDVLFYGQPIDAMQPGELLDFRRRVQVVFQDPYSSLDPRLTLSEIIIEGYDIHGLYTPIERRERAVHLLETVGLDASYGQRHPHELSGGQRQRVAIARALSLEPKVLIADEPTSALDVSVKAQIINLLEELKEQIGLSLLFISHDLSAVRHISDRILVMYRGQLVETATADDLFAHPLHPYTRMLLDAIPIPDPRRQHNRLTLAQHREAADAALGPDLRLKANDGGEEALLIEARPDHFIRCYPVL